MSKVNHSFRKGKSGGFAYVSNDVLKNEKLSLEAKGLYSYIQTYIQIPDIEVSKKFLLENCISNDKEIFNKAWNELKEAGFIKEYQILKENGEVVEEYEIVDFLK